MPESEACNFVKKDTLAQVFSSEFCEISKNTFFIEHLWATASVVTVKQFIKTVLKKINLVRTLNKHLKKSQRGEIK